MRRTKRWALLRHLFKACWAFQGSLEALCCVCLEPSEKRSGLLCPSEHKNPLLCFDCLEPYVSSLIGTSELRRQEGGISCPACVVGASDAPHVFPRRQVQQQLSGPTLRRFIEATDPQPLEAVEEDEDFEAEMQVLVEDLRRSVRIVACYRVSEHDEPREAHRVKDILPFTWLQCGEGQSFFQYDPEKMRLRQHLSPRLFATEVAQCLNLECPNPDCRALLDPDPDGCVAMSCRACEEGFCWVCFERCGFGGDAHPHVLDIHGDYFPSKPFTEAWHRKHRWKRVQRILGDLLEETREEALLTSAQMLKDVGLWPFPSIVPDPPKWVEGADRGRGWAEEAVIHAAARFGQVDLLMQALEAEDVNARNDRGMTALCFAAHEGRLEAIRLLMERAADPNIADDHGVTPLHYACREPPFLIEDDVAGLLLSYENVDANQRDLSGATAIMVAAEVGRAQVIPSLLRCERVEPNLTNMSGYTALFLAVLFDHVDVVLALLTSHRVTVARRSPDGETVLHLAARRGGREMAELLLAHPEVDVNATSASGRTSLMEAASVGAQEVVGCILEKEGVVCDLVDAQGFSPLLLAAQNGSAGTFEMLLPVSLGTINARNHEGKNVLMILAERGPHSDSPAHCCLCTLLRFARDSGIALDVNVQCHKGRTALMWAVASGSLASAESLMALQPELDRQDERGETAWSLASIWGHKPELFQSLRRLFPESEPPSGLLLFDGVLLRSVERVNRTLLAAGGGGHLCIPNHAKLTVEFAAAPLWSWKQAGYALHDGNTFFAEHEACERELIIQRVNGVPWSPCTDVGYLQSSDFIKLKDRRQVLRFSDWLAEGWAVKAQKGDLRFCHWGARKIQAAQVVCEEELPGAAFLGDFLSAFA
ncbi:ANKRD50 [Symbiodinium natans]|uniref:ANKRD50 protein n=1 Tax=Symbiodinium natans TaxID=878477 RepID=A0A812PGX0_9DINO|nr:ANKRD50 [Symbiodinium natans]